MTIQWSTALRNARLDAIETAIGTSAKFQIWSGAVPANCAASPAGTKLLEISLASDWASNAASGVKALSSLPLSGSAAATGTATFYRFTDSAGTTCHEQGTVATSGGDATIDNTSINSGQTVNVTAFSKTEPGA